MTEREDEIVRGRGRGREMGHEMEKYEWCF